MHAGNSVHTTRIFVNELSGDFSQYYLSGSDQGRRAYQILFAVKIWFVLASQRCAVYRVLFSFHIRESYIEMVLTLCGAMVLR